MAYEKIYIHRPVTQATTPARALSASSCYSIPDGKVLGAQAVGPTAWTSASTCSLSPSVLVLRCSICKNWSFPTLCPTAH